MIDLIHGGFMFIPQARKIYTVPNSSCDIHILDVETISDTQVKIWSQFVTKGGHVVDLSLDTVELKNIQHWQEKGAVDDLLSR